MLTFQKSANHAENIFEGSGNRPLGISTFTEKPSCYTFTQELQQSSEPMSEAPAGSITTLPSERYRGPILFNLYG